MRHYKLADVSCAPRRGSSEATRIHHAYRPRPDALPIVLAGRRNGALSERSAPCASTLRLPVSTQAVQFSGTRVRRPLKRLIGPEPVCWKFHPAPDPFQSKCEVNLSAELVGDYVANCTHPETGFVRINDRRTAGLLPFEHQPKWVTVEPLLPPDRHTSLFRRQRSILCRVSGKLVQHHC